MPDEAGDGLRHRDVWCRIAVARIDELESAEALVADHHRRPEQRVGTAFPQRRSVGGPGSRPAHDRGHRLPVVAVRQPGRRRASPSDPGRVLAARVDAYDDLYLVALNGEDLAAPDVGKIAEQASRTARELFRSVAQDAGQFRQRSEAGTGLLSGRRPRRSDGRRRLPPASPGRGPPRPPPAESAAQPVPVVKVPSSGVTPSSGRSSRQAAGSVTSTVLSASAALVDTSRSDSSER